MGTPYLGEIRIMSFNFPPKAWALCNGQTLPINQNQALFSLFGTMYGGNGQTTFALPNLQGRIPMHFGSGHIQGEVVGQESHTLTQSEMPAHVHPLTGSSLDGSQSVPAGALLAGSGRAQIYTAPSGAATRSLTTLDPSAVSSVGGGQPHENRQPFLTLSFCVALQGIFPSRN